MNNLIHIIAKAAAMADWRVADFKIEYANSFDLWFNSEEVYKSYVDHAWLFLSEIEKAGMAVTTNRLIG